MFTLTTLFIVFAAVIGSTAMTAVVAYLLYRTRGLPGGTSDRELGQKVDLMHDELMAMRDEVARLHERADFTEKLLMSGDSSDSDGDRAG